MSGPVRGERFWAAPRIRRGNRGVQSERELFKIEVVRAVSNARGEHGLMGPEAHRGAQRYTTAHTGKKKKSANSSRSAAASEGPIGPISPRGFVPEVPEVRLGRGYVIGGWCVLGG